MPAAARQGDPDTSDGTISGAVSGDVIINGKPAALLGSIETPHAPYGKQHPPHSASTIVSASGTVIVNGKGLAYEGSSLSCGHAIASGSPDVETAA
jgi:uncharacterized Zn-binding protein involved in type VI secretion